MHNVTKPCMGKISSKQRQTVDFIITEHKSSVMNSDSCCKKFKTLLLPPANYELSNTNEDYHNYLIKPLNISPFSKHTLMFICLAAFSSFSSSLKKKKKDKVSLCSPGWSGLAIQKRLLLNSAWLYLLPMLKLRARPTTSTWLHSLHVSLKNCKAMNI